MKILLTYFFRIIKKNWLSFLLIVFSLCLVSSTIYVNFSIDSDVLNSSLNQLEETYHGFDASLKIEDEDNYLDSNTAFDKADRSLAFNISYEESSLNGSDLYIYQIDTEISKVADYSLLSLTEGTWPANDNEILITRNKSDLLSLSVGNVIKSGNNELKITGIIENASLFAMEYPNILESFGVVKDNEKCNFFIFDYSCDKDEFVSSLSLDSSDYSFTVFEIDDFDKETELKIIFALILIMIAVIASFVIYSSLTMMINSQQKAMATFISVGASRKTIDLFLLSESMTEGILGGVIGMFSGELFRFLVYHFYLGGKGFILFASPLFLLVSFVFTVLLQGGVTIISLVRFHARSEKDNMMKIDNGSSLLSKLVPYCGFLLMVTALVIYFTNTSKNLILLFISMGSFFIGFVMAFSFVVKLIFHGLSALFKKHSLGTAYLASNALSREKICIRNTLLTTMVLSLSFLSLFVTTSMNQFFTDYEARYNYDIVIRGNNGYSLSESDCTWIMESTEGIDHIVKEYWEYAQSTINGKEIDRHVFYVRQNEELGGMRYLDYDIVNNPLKEGQCLIDELLASHYGFSVGEEIMVHFTDYDSSYKDFSVTIAGYCDSSIFNDNRDTIVLSDEDYYQNITTSIHKLGLRLKEGVSLNDVMSKFEYLSFSTMIGEYYSIQDVSSYVREEYDTVSRIVTLLGSVPVFITILSVLGLVNNELLLFEEKKKSYAVLASTCMEKPGLCRLIFLELLMMFVSGLIFAFVTECFLVYLVRDILYVLFTYVEVKYSLISLLSLGGITFLVLCLGFVLSVRKVMKMNVVKEIRYE